MIKKTVLSLLMIMLLAFTVLSSYGCNGTEETPADEPTTAPTTSATTPVTTTGDWWEKFGEPQYGGEIVLRSQSIMESWDPGTWLGYRWGYMECLFYRDWTVDREECGFFTELVAPEYYTSGLAESWEQSDPTTYIVKIHEGIKWQNKEPMNGRELTAYDVEYSYDRILGTGNGFTEKNPIISNGISNVEKVVALDDYTLEFQMKNSAALTIYDLFDGGFFPTIIIAPEMVENNIFDSWETSVGTGPWMLTDFVSGSAATYTRNPDYWGYDERYPENQLPYADTLKEVVIADMATVMAAMRSGQIDTIPSMNAISPTQLETLLDTNPDTQVAYWPTPGVSIEMRVDQAPFTDIRVRKALQMALPLDVIAEAHYDGTVSGTPEGLVNPDNFGDWTVPYAEWSAELQAEYSYNPERAMELLAEAGYPDGFDTKVICSATDDTELMEIAKAYFQQIGVEMEIEVFADNPTKMQYAMAGKSSQMTESNTVGHSKAPFQSILARTPQFTENYTKCDDAEYNALVAACNTASTIEEAQQYCKEAEIYALEQHWAVNLFSTMSPIVWQPWLKGYSGEQTVAGVHFYWTRCWIDQELKSSMGH